MTRYVLRRLVLLPLLLFVFSVAVFAIVQAPPGDFLTSYMATLASSGSSVSTEQFEALRRDYGLDQPLYVQYWKWMERPPGEPGPVTRIPAAQYRADRRAAGADRDPRPLLVRLHLGGRDPDRDLLGYPPALRSR